MIFKPIAFLLLSGLCSPLAAEDVASPDPSGMSLPALKAFYDEGALLDYQKAVAELLKRGEKEEIRKNLRDPHPNRDHYMTAWALAVLEPEDFLDDMAALIADQDPGVRYYAVYYLTGLGKSAYAGRIEKLLSDSSPDVRRISAEYFGQLKLVKYAAAVSRLAADPDEEVRKQAKTSLEQLR